MEANESSEADKSSDSSHHPLTSISTALANVKDRLLHPTRETNADMSSQASHEYFAEHRKSREV